MHPPRAATVFRRIPSAAKRVTQKIPGRRSLSHSSVEGPLHPPLETRTLSDYFTSHILRNFSAQPALICRSERPRAHHGPPSHNLGVDTHLAWDFAEFDRHINALARGLLAMGVRKGDRVGVVMGNNRRVLLASWHWACAHIGAILVTLNPAYRAQELVTTLKLVGVKHLFVVPRIRSSAYVEMLGGLMPDLKHSQPGHIQTEELPELRNLVLVDNHGEYQAELEKLGVRSTIDWREIIMWREDSHERKTQRDISASLEKDEVINLQFTSYTTSFRRFIYRRTRLVLGNLAAWSHGASIIYPSAVFDPKAIVDTVVAERCTALHGVPTHFLGVLAEFDERQKNGEKLNTSSLRTGIAAGSPIPIELMKNLIAKLNLVDLTNAYGMTETSPVSFQTTPADDIIKRVETVGKVQPHVKAKLVDLDGNVVPVGTPGEICIAGYLMQKGYWEDEAQTQLVMKKDNEGTLWMHTGDEGIMDEEGYLKIVGRIKDIIIRGGENLFPVQIENALTTQESIEEAAVVSVPDEKYGEVVGAWIVRRNGTSASRESIRAGVAQSMNPQNAPAWVWFLGEDGTPEELPKTASGKVMKHVLRKWSKDLAQKEVGRVPRP
ncbi:hypothetical protein H0H81_000104 [Sphagnurus paluster]|uniref:Uncharacterized protein n=1 Tax=Sphagnurus paluster TaxID=117069 RepID=A0A9P7GPT4_9AGAR|nr:hypothetical protein H0H81_000104 [Sphagnurus paluster]